MAKYKVFLRGTVKDFPGGYEAFLSAFAKAYKKTNEEARDFINRSQGLIYTYDDLDKAEKGQAFLEKLGAVVELVEEQEEKKVEDPLMPPDIGDTATYVPHRSYDDPNQATGLSSFDDDLEKKPAEEESPTVKITPTPAEPAAAPAVPPAVAPASPPVATPAIPPAVIPAVPPSVTPAAPAVTAPSPPAEEAAAVPDGTRPCPKCGHPVPVGEDECPKCQIFISKYEKMMQRRAQQQQQLYGAPGGASPQVPGPPTPGAPAPGGAPGIITPPPIGAPGQAAGPSSAAAGAGLAAGMASTPMPTAPLVDTPGAAPPQVPPVQAPAVPAVPPQVDVSGPPVIPMIASAADSVYGPASQAVTRAGPGGALSGTSMVSLDPVAAAAAAGVRTVSDKAKSSLMIGIFGVFCVGFILGPIALFYGLMGLSEINKDPRFEGRGMAIAGIILGFAETAGWLLALIFYLNAAKETLLAP